MERLEVVFVGRVQGVYFRATAEDLARDFAVTGYVRNEPDGSVRLVAEGERDELEGFLAAVKQAKRDNIQRTDEGWRRATGEFNEFRIAYR